MPAIADPPAPAAQTQPKPGDTAASYLDTLMHGEKPSPKPPEKKPAPATPAEPKPAPSKPAAKKKAAAPAPAIDPKEIAEAAARGAAEGFAKAQPKPEQKPDPLADLSEEERERYEVYQRVEKDFPKQYPGAAERYLKALKAADQWEVEWLAKHPGQELSENDTEYQAFLEANALEVDDLHLQKSLAKMEAEKLVAQDREDRAKRESEDAKKNKAAEAEPHANATALAATRDYAAAIGNGFEKIVDDSGKPNRAEIDRLVAEVPGASAVLQEVQGVQAFSRDVSLLSSGATAFDEKNPAHQYIAEFVDQHESDIAGLTDDEQAQFVAGLPERLRNGREGKRFATSAEFNKMTERQRAQHFRLWPADIAYLYSVERAQKAKEAIADEEKRVAGLAERRGWKKVETNGAPAPKPNEIRPEPKPATPPPPSPSGAVAPMPAPSSAGLPSRPKNAADSFVSMFIG